jgi:hypothetical protein
MKRPWLAKISSAKPFASSRSPHATGPAPAPRDRHALPVNELNCLSPGRHGGWRWWLAHLAPGRLRGVLVAGASCARPSAGVLVAGASRARPFTGVLVAGASCARPSAGRLAPRNPHHRQARPYWLARLAPFRSRSVLVAGAGGWRILRQAVFGASRPAQSAPPASPAVLAGASRANPFTQRHGGWRWWLARLAPGRLRGVSPREIRTTGEPHPFLPSASPSTLRHPPSTIHHPPSTIHHPPSAIHHPPSAPLSVGSPHKRSNGLTTPRPFAPTATCR